MDFLKELNYSMVISKEYYNRMHYLILDDRPEEVKLTVKNTQHCVFLIMPSNFYSKFIILDQFWNKVFDIIMTGTIELDRKNRAYHSKLFLYISGFAQKNRKFNQAAILLRQCSSFLEYCSYFNPKDFRSIDCHLHDIIQHLYLNGKYNTSLDLCNSIYKNCIPGTVVENLYSSNFGKKALQTFNQVFTINAGLLEEKYIYFVFPCHNNYSDIISNLYSNHNKQIEELITKYNLFFWLDQGRKKIYLKIDKHQDQKKIFHCLAVIDYYINKEWKNSLLKVSAELLPLLTLKFSNPVLNKLGTSILDIYTSLLTKKNLNENLLRDVFISTLEKVISSIDENKKDKFLDSLWFYSFAKHFGKIEVNYFNSFNKYYDNRIKNIHINYKSLTVGVVKKFNVDVETAIKKFTNALIREMKKQSKSSSSEYFLSDELDLFDYGASFKKSDIIEIRSIRLVFEKLAECFGIEEQTKLNSIYYVLKQRKPNME